MNNKVNWVEVPKSNIKSDRDAKNGENISAFVIDGDSEEVLQEITYNPSTPDQENEYNWPKYFADKINEEGQLVRAGLKDKSGRFYTLSSNNKNKLWKPDGKKILIFSTNCHLDSWIDGGELKSFAGLPAGMRVGIEVKSKGKGVIYETMSTLLTPENSDKYRWPNKLSTFINEESLFIRAGEKDTKTKFITPLSSTYRNHFWLPAGSDLTVNLTFEATEDLVKDAESTYNNAVVAFKGSPPSKKTVEAWISKLKDGKFNDITYPPRKAGTNTAPLLTHLNRTKSLADYVCSIPQEQREPYLFSAVAALSFYTSMDFQTSNWWSRQIGLARVAASAALLLADKAASAQLHESIEYLKKTTDTTTDTQTGANLADFSSIQLCWSLAGWKSSSEFEYLIYTFAASEAVSSLCSPVKRHGPPDDGNGISKDWSFSQHNPDNGKYSQLYAGSYGLVLLRDIFHLQPVLSGAFSLHKDALNNLETFLLKGLGWFIYRGLYDFQVCGRAISRKGMTTSKTLVGWSRQLLALSPQNPGALQELLKRAGGDESNNNYFKGNHVYWVNDYMSHIASDFCLWTKVISTRTVGTETGNGENIKGYYMGGGSCFITQSGKEYYEIQPLWEWQRIPGTTTEQVPSFKYPQVKWGNNAWGSHDLAGVVSDGQKGVSSMILTRQNIKNARKSVFAMGNNVFCIGSGIDTTAAHNPVYTSINQAIASKATARGIVTVVLKNGDIRYLNVGEGITSLDIYQVLHDGFTYTFPDNIQQKVTAEVASKTGSWRDINTNQDDAPVTGNVFSLWIEHVPGRQEQYLYQITKNGNPLLGFQNVSYKDDVHMFIDDDKKQAAATFFSTPETSISLADVDIKPLATISLLADNTVSNTLQLTIADLTQKLSKIKITFTWKTNKYTKELELPSGDDAGESITYQLKPGG